MPGRVIGAAVVFATCSRLVHAEPAPPFSELLRQAEVTAPRLAEREANIRAAQGAALQAAARPNPTVDLLAENLGGGAFNGAAVEQNTLSFSQPLEIGGQRSARVAAANASVETARAELQQARSDFIYDLGVGYVTAELTNARVGLAREALDRARVNERAARALVDAGREAELRAVEASAATAAAEADVETAQSEATEALVRLAALVGRPQPYTEIGRALLDSASRLHSPPFEPPVTSPAVRSAEAARVAAARRVEVERRRATPDVSLSVGIRQFSGENGKALVAGIGIPLPLFNNNRGAIAAAEAELAAADARLAAAMLNAQADWRAAGLQAISAERRVLAATQAEMSANEAYRLARVGYDAGRTPLVEVLTASRNASEAQSRTLEAVSSRLRAEATLSRLTGATPFGESP